MNNDATTNVVALSDGKTTRVYTVMKGQPVASVGTKRSGSEIITIEAAREEIASYLAQGWKLV